MKRLETFLLLIVMALGAFIFLEARKGRGRAPAAAADSVIVDSLATVELRTQEGDLVRVRRSTIPAPGPKDYRAINQTIAEARDVTYLDEILVSRGGNIARWIDRRDNPITVWIQKSPQGVSDFWPEYPTLARDAFYTWSNAGIPLRFLFIDDSASAEVRVRWVDRFTDSAAGKTYWARDVNWWILGADVELSLHSAEGQAYDRQAVHAIALHEVGHLIGLDHSANRDNIMSPRVHTMRLSTADLRTANVIYRLPPGPVRDTTVAATP